MSNDLTLPGAERFGLTSFADLLSSRPPILGEAPGTFEEFRGGMMRSLTPFTPYECVVAENLVAIEWELYQQRRMRDAGLRRDLRHAVQEAVMATERGRHEAALDVAWNAFATAGGDDKDWEEPFDFDAAAAEMRADDLATRAVSQDRDVQSRAQDAVAALGVSPLDLMSDVYRSRTGAATRHDDKVRELERRRREVKRDYDALQKARPLDAEDGAAEVLEG